MTEQTENKLGKLIDTLFAETAGWEGVGPENLKAMFESVGSEKAINGIVACTVILKGLNEAHPLESKVANAVLKMLFNGDITIEQMAKFNESRAEVPE